MYHMIQSTNGHRFFKTVEIAAIKPLICINEFLNSSENFVGHFARQLFSSHNYFFPRSFRKVISLTSLSLCLSTVISRLLKI